MTNRPSLRRAKSAPFRTVGDLVRFGARRFKAMRLAFGHGTINAFDEAAYLALHSLRLPPDELAPHLARPVSGSEVRKALRLFERRVKERKPAAYLTGEAWLGGLRFHVDERVIVPRSYIAELLRDDLAPWISRPRKVRRALDLCTGSGCLAVLLARSFPRARIDATDISRDALRVARRNVATHGLKGRVRLVHSDLFEALAGRRYDLIVSNPPYVRSAVMRRLPREYRWEPALALAGGDDGLAIIRAILHNAASLLNPGGLLIVEAGHNRTAVERAFPRIPFTWPTTSGGDGCVFLVYREELAGLNGSAA